MNASHQTARFYMGSVTHFLGRLAAVLSHREDAIQHYEAALETNERMGARPSLARTRYEYARLLLNRGPGAWPGAPVPEAQERHARGLLAEAERTTHQLGMAQLLERVRELR
jgi:hypothetical protein